jgi:HPt (histidine-containing phosphotransfer) domain-containing protein
MTANAMEGDRERALACGMNDHISKPLNVEGMFATLAKWIKPSARQPAPLPQAELMVDELPDSLEGIDMTAGLATCMGRRELYLRLLRKFRDAQAGFAEQFQAALANPDAQAAERLAHSLRGTAGNIGAKGVAQVAAELERACQAGESAAVQGLAAEVQRVLAPTLAALARLSGAGQEKRGEVLQEGELRRHLSRLKQLLAESDTAAMGALAELRRQSHDPALAECLALVAQQVELFDFDRALQLLQDGKAP